MSVAAVNWHDRHSTQTSPGTTVRRHNPASGWWVAWSPWDPAKPGAAV